MSNLYVYGVVDPSDDADFGIDLAVDGVGGADRIYAVEYRRLAAIVSDIDTTDPERTDEAVTRHNDVLQTLMESWDGGTVVPMRFGMAFKNARTLKGVLRGAREPLQRTLNKIDGKTELGLKVVAGPGTAVDGAAVRETVADLLSDIVVNQTDDDLFSDRLVLNRSYLIAKADREAFDAAVDEIEAIDDDLTVQYTGPWPPYNFVDIQIGAKGQQ